MKGRTVLTLLLFGGFVMVTPGSAKANSIVSIEPAATMTSVGHTLALNVDVSNVTDLFAFQFDIDFNPAVLSATGVTEGSFLPSGGSTFFIPGTIDNVRGTVTFNADTLIGPVPGVNGSGILATFDFRAIGSGVSSIDLANLTFLNSAGAAISISPSSGTVDVGKAAITPEPPASSLVVMGLTAFAWFMRRKH